MSPYDPHPARRAPRTSAAGRVLVMAPTGDDAPAIEHVLTEHGLEVRVCEDLAYLATQIARWEPGPQAIGAVIIAQEALLPMEGRERQALAGALARQPEWSDLPLILLAGGPAGEDGAWEIARGLEPVGNITILERPLRRTTLLNAVSVALRARARQHDLRSTLRELSQHRERLETLVEQRTAELSASATRLIVAERLAALGRLAAGLGHDLANLTLPIRARLDALHASCDSPEAKADVDAMRLSLVHLGRLSAGMRLMALDPERARASAPALDLTEWAAETAPILRAALPRQVRLECDVAPGLSVSASRHQLAQAIFNLVQNAGEAMAGRAAGLVRVEACGRLTQSGESVVRIRVIDDGPGMTPAAQARCFEPYFSTKSRAIATGMGLGIVKGITEAAGGTIGVESAPGVGATFTLTLPAAPADRGNHARARSPLTGAVSVGHERTAGLICLFLEHVGARHVRHEGPEIPSAPLWVVDEPNLGRVAAYLREDSGRRVVALGDGTSEGASSVADLCATWHDRVCALPRFPTAGALRDALASSCAPASGGTDS